MKKTALRDYVKNWALPKEQLFPLDSPELVKMASESFETQIENMTPSQLLVCARNICAHSDDVGSMAHKYAGSKLSQHFPSFLNMRKEATAHLADDDLDKLLKVASVYDSKSDVVERVKGLDKIAQVLEDFDRQYGIQDLWDTKIPDPGYSVYGQTLNPHERIQASIKVANYNVTANDLDSADWSRIDGKLPEEVVGGLKTAGDKMAVFASLPDPEKELVYQSLFMG